VQLGLWPAEPAAPAGHPSSAPDLPGRLRALGLPPFPLVVTHQNAQVMVSWLRGRWLRLHTGYAHAPDEVLRAIVTFVTPGVRRERKLAARRLFLSFPVERHLAPRPPRRPRIPRVEPGDEPALARLRALHGEFNARHFGGALAGVPILLSARMKRRLGELRMQQGSGRPVHIALSRRHLRRDGWAAAGETLLHEMVHQWQAETGQPVDHGAGFRRKAREVGIHPGATSPRRAPQA
jgi:hypothetical protein